MATYIRSNQDVMCSERECFTSALTHDADTKLNYCAKHLVERISLEERHRIVKEGHESEVDVLTMAVDMAYHYLENATKVIEKVAQRLPNCGEMPTGSIKDEK